MIYELISRAIMAEDIAMVDEGATLYEIRESPGKGKGVFASQDIKDGTRIWQENTLIVVEEDMGIEFLRQFEALEKIRPENIEKFKQLRHVGHLPPVRGYHFQSHDELSAPASKTNRGRVLTEKAFKDMMEVDASGKKLPKEEFAHIDLKRWRQEAAKALSIFDNNAFKIPRFKNDDQSRSVFFTAAHLNHSCIPNCNTIWNHDIKKFCVHAVRDIAAGEELVITYHVDEVICMQREERMKHLRRLFGFTCTCSACDPASKFCARMEATAHSNYKIKQFRLTAEKYSPKLVGQYTKVLNLMEEDNDLDN